METSTSASSAKNSPVATSASQIIDFEGCFNSGFEGSFRDMGIASAGFKYNVVTVLGCQSSGKSTVLNSLFGTSFPEMNAFLGRSRTTLGIWAARDRGSNTLVIDVEGTDSKERGEDRLTFEHRASLFSLAIADAVLVNMWYHDLGRYTASNYGLLKTVFAVNLELFHQEPAAEKTTMVFLIRDYSTAVTPLHLLEEMLHKDLREIWKDIKKPADKEGTSAEDFFDFVVVGVPSKVTDTDGYNDTVNKLRDNWYNKIRPEAYSRGVPADGFGFYCRQVWETIMQSSELDIPSQKEMVATYRCEEIKQMVLSEIRPVIWECKNDPERLFKDNIAANSIKESLVKYHESASRYQDEVYSAKREQLLDAVMQEIQKQFDSYLYERRAQLLKRCQKDLGSLCRKDDSEPALMFDGSSRLNFWEGLAKKLEVWHDESMTAFDGVCGESGLKMTVKLDDKTSYEVDREFEMSLVRKNFEEGLMDLEKRCVQTETEAFREYLRDRIEQLRDDVTSKFVEDDTPDKTLWDQITKSVGRAIDGFVEEFAAVIRGLIGEDEEDRCHDYLSVMVLTCLKEQYLQRIDYIPTIIHDRFKVRFENDTSGVPHFWAGLTQDKIRAVYLDAKKRTESLVPCLRRFDVRWKDLIRKVDDVDPSFKSFMDKPLLTESKYREVEAFANKRMLKSCQEAQFIQATGGKPTAIPWFMWVLLLVFGWNEIMVVIRSPIFTMAAITVTLVLGGAWYSGNMMRLANSARSVMSLGLGMVLPVLNSLNSSEAGGDAREVQISK